MTDPDLPRQLEEAGIISREQAEQLHAIICRDNAREYDVEGSTMPPYEPLGITGQRPA